MKEKPKISLWTKSLRFLRKYSLVIFIALGLLRLLSQERPTTFGDVLLNIAVTAIMYGIFIWGYRNVARNRIDKKKS